MLWEVEIRPGPEEVDREGLRVEHEANSLGIRSIGRVRSARSYLLQGEQLTEADSRRAATTLLADPVAETFSVSAVTVANVQGTNSSAPSPLVPLPRGGEGEKSKSNGG
jgi:phosphoribosylformylglycinamidine synthase